MNPGSPQFGGKWTREKLQSVQQYLSAYTTALKNQNFELLYIDAFAGTGYMDFKRKSAKSGDLFEDIAQGEALSSELMAGSAAIALETEPPFERFIFIEKNAKRASELKRLLIRNPGREIEISHGDANKILAEICDRDWGGQRAVLFLDPFGMSVDWSTLRTVAGTQAIDVWYLFPLMAVIRLLPKDAKIERKLAERLNRLFGADDWREEFYSRKKERTLWDDVETIERSASVEEIKEYFSGRLKDLFAGVAENPRLLSNSKNAPLFLLYFAMGNPSAKARSLALKMAGHL